MFSVYHLAVIDEIAGRKNPDNLKYWFTNWQIHNYRGRTSGSIRRTTGSSGK